MEQVLINIINKFNDKYYSYLGNYEAAVREKNYTRVVEIYNTLDLILELKSYVEEELDRIHNEN